MCICNMKLNNVLFVSLVIALFAGCEEPIRQKECWVIILKMPMAWHCY